jgi:hypothetical protein
MHYALLVTSRFPNDEPDEPHSREKKPWHFFHSATKHNSTLLRYTCMREVFVHRPTTSKWLLEVAASWFVCLSSAPFSLLFTCCSLLGCYCVVVGGGEQKRRHSSKGVSGESAGFFVLFALGAHIFPLFLAWFWSTLGTFWALGGNASISGASSVSTGTLLFVREA